MNRKIYLDSCCVIYLLENVAVFGSNMRKHLQSVPDAVLCVSPLVRLEVLVKPINDGDTALINDYEDFLRQQQWLSINDQIIAAALQLRTRHQIKIPDAIHLATAIHYDCQDFWTHDDHLNYAAQAAGCHVVSIKAS